MKSWYLLIMMLITAILAAMQYRLPQVSWYASVLFDASLVFTIAYGIETWLAWMRERALARRGARMRRMPEDNARLMDYLPWWVRRFYFDDRPGNDRLSFYGWHCWAPALCVALIGYHAATEPVTLWTYAILATSVNFALVIYQLFLIGEYITAKEGTRRRYLRNLVAGFVICATTVLITIGNSFGWGFVLWPVSVVICLALACGVAYACTMAVKRLVDWVEHVRARLALATRLETEAQTLYTSIQEAMRHVHHREYVVPMERGTAPAAWLAASLAKAEAHDRRLNERILRLEQNSRTTDERFTNYGVFITNLLRELLPDIVQVASECSDIASPAMSQSRLASWRRRLNLVAALIAMHADDARMNRTTHEPGKIMVWPHVQGLMSQRGLEAVCRRFTTHTRPENTPDLRWAPDVWLDNLRDKLASINGPAPDEVEQPNP